jgi:putative glutamine amidotransferase
VPTAWAPDGTVEGVEATDRSFVVGVQWHAECLVDHAEQAALFSALVDASRVRAVASDLAVAGSA